MQQKDELLEAAKPLIRWLKENCDPHARALVDLYGVELVQGVASHHTEEFVKD